MTKIINNHSVFKVDWYEIVLIVLIVVSGICLKLNPIISIIIGFISLPLLIIIIKKKWKEYSENPKRVEWNTNDNK
jgi:hypothetical protein